MKIYDEYKGTVHWTGNVGGIAPGEVTKKKIAKLESGLFNLGTEYIEDLDLIIKTDECPIEVLEVLSKWRPSDEDTTPRVHLQVSKLSDEGAQILSGWNGNNGFGRLYLTELKGLTDVGAQHLLNSGTFLVVSSKNLPGSAFEILSRREIDDSYDNDWLSFRPLEPLWER
jgi:hypothetical protein